VPLFGGGPHDGARRLPRIEEEAGQHQLPDGAPSSCRRRSPISSCSSGRLRTNLSMPTLRVASLGGRGVVAQHDVSHPLIHSLLGVTRHAALRMLGAGVLPAFPKGNHRWLLAFPSLGKCRRAEEERPGETGPAVDPVAVSALPRCVGRSVGSTSRFGRDGWPQGQPHSTSYSENVCKTPRRKIRPGRGRSNEARFEAPPGALGNVPLSGRCRCRRTWRSRASTRPLAVSVTCHMPVTDANGTTPPSGMASLGRPRSAAQPRARKLVSVIG
jgi:hypothetical protein